MVRFFVLLTGILLLSSNLFAQKTASRDIVDYSYPEEYVIKEVNVKGVEFLDENVLVQISGLTVGQQISIPGDEITKAINKFWEQGLFSDVKIYASKFEGNEVYLTIELKERPRLGNVYYKGIKNSEEKELEEKLNLRRGSQVTENILNNSKNLINEYFVEKGFLDTDIEIEKSKDSIYVNTINLTFHIDKNDKIKVNNIIFRGNTVFNDRQLWRTMKEIKRKKWFNIFRPSRYTDEKLETDKKSIIKKYNELGYRDAKIVKDSVYRHDDKTMNVLLDIYEGDKYYFGDITWVGNTHYTSEMLSSALKIEKGNPYDKAILEKRLYVEEDAVSNLYLDNGYLFFQVTPVEVNIEEDTIDLEMRIYEGEQATIDEIFISGNTKTNEHVIRRELRSKPGELFRKTNIKRSIRELANLGHFDPEKLDVKPIPDPASGTVDLEYKVVEKANDQLEVSGGWGGQYYGLVGTIGVRFNNFSAGNIFKKEAWKPLPTGDGQTLSIRAQANGKYYQSYNFSFVEPWLGGKKPNSFSVSLFHSKYSGSIYSNYYGRSRSRSTGRYLKRTGASVGLGRRLTVPDDYFTLYNEVSYQYYNLKNYNIGLGFTDGGSNHFNIKTRFGRNSVDQLIYPRRGSEFSLGLQITPPYSLLNDRDYTIMSPQEKYNWIEYHKWTFNASWYHRLVENLVLAAKTRFGYLGHFNNEIGTAPFEGFELGGDGMTNSYWLAADVVALRGYENNALTSRTRGRAASVYSKYTMEIRYPVALKEQATVYLLGFLEGGNAWYKFKEFEPFSIKRSAGIGLRAFLPMFGMLGVDWGYGFDPLYDANGNMTEGLNGSQFHFVIGQEF